MWKTGANRYDEIYMKRKAGMASKWLAAHCLRVSGRSCFPGNSRTHSRMAPKGPSTLCHTFETVMKSGAYSRWVA